MPHDFNIQLLLYKVPNLHTSQRPLSFLSSSGSTYVSVSLFFLPPSLAGSIIAPDVYQSSVVSERLGFSSRLPLFSFSSVSLSPVASNTLSWLPRHAPGDGTCRLKNSLCSAASPPEASRAAPLHWTPSRSMLRDGSEADPSTAPFGSVSRVSTACALE